MVIRRSLFLLFILVIVLALAAPAAASFNLDVSVEEPSGPIPPGGSVDLQVTVAVTSNENMFCVNGGTFDVAMTVEGEDAEFEFWGDISPNSLEFTVEGPAAYGGAGAEAWTGEETTTFTPRVGQGVNPSHLNHQLTVRASYEGDQPGDCVIIGAQEWTPNDGAASLNVQAQAPEEEEEENGDGNDNGQEPDTEEGPAPAVAFILVATFVVVALRRR